jgi:nucleoside-diphosphate-sugar epimerase
MIVEEVRKFFPNSKVIYQKNGSDARNYRVDFSKIKRVLGFEPKYSINHGIQEIQRALQNNFFPVAPGNLYGNYKLNC